MIKHLVLLNDKQYYASLDSLAAQANGYTLKTINSGNVEYTELFFKHNGTMNKFSFPKGDSKYLHVTVSGTSDLIGGSRTYIELGINTTFFVPNVTLPNGIVSQTNIDTEGAIIPGNYGFMLVKRNVPFNERNKWYIELIIKEDTQYSDFAALLQTKLREIDENLSVAVGGSDDNITISTSNWEHESYDIFLDDLAKYAFVKHPTHAHNQITEEMLLKLCTECDADYGFDYTETAGENLYPGRNPQALYNKLVSLIKTSDVDSNNTDNLNNSLYMVSIKLAEPSLYRTLDPIITQSYTIFATKVTINNILLSLNIDNVLETDLNDSEGYEAPDDSEG